MGFNEVPPLDSKGSQFQNFFDLIDTPSRWNDYYVFAHEFDGYEAFPDDLAERASRVAADWCESGSLPDDLDLLRACLFFEARSSRFMSGYPDEAAMKYIDPLVAKIKALIHD